jgi:hypothetical protein
MARTDKDMISQGRRLKGDNARTVEVYAVDDGLLAEMRNHEKQAAQEPGPWTDKTQVTGDAS